MQINDTFTSQKLSPSQRSAVEKLSLISELTLQSVITTGRSGASVFVANVKPITINGPKGLHILKIDRRGQARQELNSHTAASTTAIKPYMPNLVESSPTQNGYVATIYSFAHNTLINSAPLHELIERNFKQSISQVKKVADILLSWNSNVSVQYESPYHLLRNILGTLIEGKNGIRAIAQRILGVDKIQDILYFQDSDQILPNPIFYLMHKEAWTNTKPIAWPCGNVHGDLHSGNIICPLSNSERHPILIDFTLYKQDFLIFYDYAYLEFELLLQTVPPVSENSRGDWLELSRVLASGIEPPKSLIGGPQVDIARQLITPLCRAITQKAQKENQQDDFISCYILARTAVGLNYFRKLRDSEHECKLALLFAAQNLNILLKRLNVQITNTKPVSIPWTSQNKTLSDAHTKELYDILRNQFIPEFLARRVILILGPSIGKWAGFPGERTLAEKIAQACDIPMTSFTEEDNPACFNPLLRNNLESEKIRIAVEENNKPDQETIAYVQTKAKSLAQKQWLSIVDWSFSPWLRDYFSTILKDRRNILSITSIDDTDRINLRNQHILPWIFLRGNTENISTLVLGDRELRLPKNRSYREKALEQLLKTGPQDNSTSVLFLGCAGAVLKDIYDLLQGVYQNNLKTWVVSINIDRDDIARQLTHDGLNVIAMSPEDFAGFLDNELPEVEISESTNNRYVMNLKGIEIISERTDADQSPSPIIRRIKDNNDRIVSVSIPTDKFATFSQYLEVLYQNIEIDTLPRGHIPGDFYRGYKITWQEIALDFDIRRTMMPKFLQSVLIPDLEEQTPKRIRLQGEPGSGASTLASRLAWEVYTSYHIPVALIRRVDPGLVNVLDAVYQFRDLVQRSFLLVAEEEHINIEDADRMFEQLQARLVPITMLLVTQANQSKQITNQPIRPRNPILTDKLDLKEHGQLRDKLLPFTPQSNQQNFIHCNDNSLFINLLFAFEEGFIRLGHLVHVLLSNIQQEAKELIAAIAFCNRYTHRSAPVGFLSTITGSSRKHTMDVLEPLTDRLIIVDKELELEVNYSCRHDSIASQILRELWGTETGSGFWKSHHLVEHTISYIMKFDPSGPGNTWQRDFVARLLIGEFQQIDIRARYGYKVSRLMGDIDSASGRGRVFEAAAKQFSDDPLFLSQYGRFLYDEDTRFDEARRYLLEAFDKTNRSNSNTAHMIGMSYRRELAEHLKSLGPRKGTEEDINRSRYLLERASQYFEMSRLLSRENSYGYVSHIETLISLIEHGFRQFSRDTPYYDRLAARSDLHDWLDNAFSILEEADIYIEYDIESYLGQLRVKLDQLRGDLGQAIQAYQSLLDASRDLSRGIDPSPVRRQLSRCLYQRGIERLSKGDEKSRNQAMQDFQRATMHMEELIRDQPGNTNNIGFWFECARVDSHVDKAFLTQRLESYYTITESLNGAFYLMCLFFVRGLEERNPSAFRNFDHYLGICKRLSANLTHRLHRREWIGPDFTLLPNRIIPFDNAKGEPIVTGLPKISGVIHDIISDTRGEIAIPPYGQKILFPPSRREQRFYKSDIGKKVVFYVAFAYDGPAAYDTRPL